MGILNLFKRFQKKEEPIISEVKLTELPNWLDEFLHKEEQIVQEKVTFLKQNIQEEKQKTQENLSKLEQAGLMNEKIPERAKQIMEGNRKTYLQKMNFLLEKTTPPESLNDFPEFCQLFNQNLENFGKTTIRQYQILQEFFRDETFNLAGNLKKLDQTIKEINNTITNSQIKTILELKEKTLEFQQKIDQKEKLQQEIKSVQEKNQTKIEQITELENKIKRLDQGKEHQQYQKFIQEKDFLEKMITGIKRDPFHSFAVLEAGLKKYERLALDNQLIKNYLASPITTLEQDKELQILDILEKMQTAILNDSLELKDKKKEKILQEIKKLDKKYFTNFLEQLKLEQDKLQRNISKLEQMTITQEIAKLKETLNKEKQQLQQIEENLTELKSSWRQLGLNKLKENLEQDLKQSINEVKIIVILPQ